MAIKEIMMEKTISDFSNYEKSNYQDLLDLYQHIKNGKIPHTYRGFDFEYDKEKDMLKLASKVDYNHRYGLCKDQTKNETNIDIMRRMINGLIQVFINNLTK